MIPLTRLLSAGALLLSVTGMWVTSVALHPRLPARIPLHFSFDGTPDRYGSPDFMGWFLLPTIGTIAPLFLLGIVAMVGWLLRTSPGLVNLPRKAQLLELDPVARLGVLRMLWEMMACICIVITLGFTGMMMGTERVATGAWTTLPSWPVFVVVGVLLSIVILFNIAMSRRTKIEWLRKFGER